MQYAKLENGYLIPAPGEVRQGGMVIMNPGPDILGSMGYKPVEYTDRPEITTIRQVAMFATMAVNTMSLSDEQSLEIKDLYPEWASFIGKSLDAGFKVLYEGRLYKVRQQIATVLENQAPSELTAALYEEINETAAGTLDDPIPYNGNMELFEGKYYSQNGVTYKCTRSTGQAVYHDLSALVGIYVEKA